jgi:hypothetical protein
MQLSNFHNEFTFCLTHAIHYTMVTLFNDVSYLWQMVRPRAVEDATYDIPEGFVDHGCARGQVPHANPPPPPPQAPVSIDDLLSTQNELMRVLVRTEANHGEERLQHHR